jgi:hypothetical protein
MADHLPSHASTMLLHQLQASVAKIDAERLEAIPHKVLELPKHEGGADRFDMELFAGVDEDGRAMLTVYLEPGLGQQARYIDLTPSEARALADLMTDMVTEIEEIVAC